MKITHAEVFVNSPVRNYVTLRVHTDAGIYGLGDATLNGRELAVVSYLKDHLVPCLTGRNPFDTEDIWQYFYRGAYWRKGPVTMTALGAIDMALWDIKGKALNQPVYNLLGGRSRQKLLCYGHASAPETEGVLAAVEKMIAQGYQAIRVQTGVPGIPLMYGISSGQYEPAQRSNLPVEERDWDTRKYLNHIPEVFHQVRETIGPEPIILHDAHHRLTPMEAARLGQDLEPFDLFWLEDATPAENPAAFREIRHHTTIPLAVGEIFNSIYDAQELIQNRWIDYIRMTVSHGGGITPMLKIAHLAEAHQVRTGCHGPSDISPVALAACLHFGMAIHNYGIQEFMGYPSLVDEIFPHEYYFEDGYLHLGGSQAGLGVDFREDLASAHPYQSAYLPITRLIDGSIHDW